MIRPARFGDLDALVRLEADFPVVDQFDRRTWKRLFAGNSLVLVVEHNGDVAGALVLLFRTGTRIARLYSISVAHQVRGQGVARLLLAAAEDAAMQRRCSALRLEVRASNSQARRLYDRAGFRVMHRVDNYYPDGETALRMEKVLATPLQRAP